MKIGCCVNMLAGGGDTVGMRYIPLIKELGYDYIELPLAQVMELDADKAESLKQVLRDNEIGCECFNNFFPASVRLTGPNVSTEKIEAYIERSLQWVSGIGAKIVVFGSSVAKNIPPGFGKPEAFEQVVGTLRAAARRAGDLGITIAIECLNRAESNFINVLQEGLELLEAVNAPQVKLLVDYYHFALENESYNTLEQNIGNIVHAHIAQPRARLIPAGDDGCAEFMQNLRRLGYDSRVSLESAFIYREKELEEGLRWLRNHS